MATFVNSLAAPGTATPASGDVALVGNASIVIATTENTLTLQPLVQGVTSAGPEGQLRNGDVAFASPDGALGLAWVDEFTNTLNITGQGSGSSGLLNIQNLPSAAWVSGTTYYQGQSVFSVTNPTELYCYYGEPSESLIDPHADGDKWTKITDIGGGGGGSITATNIDVSNPPAGTTIAINPTDGVKVAGVAGNGQLQPNSVSLGTISGSVELAYSEPTAVPTATLSMRNGVNPAVPVLVANGVTNTVWAKDLSSDSVSVGPVGGGAKQILDQNGLLVSTPDNLTRTILSPNTIGLLEGIGGFNEIGAKGFSITQDTNGIDFNYKRDDLGFPIPFMSQGNVRFQTYLNIFPMLGIPIPNFQEGTSRPNLIHLEFGQSDLLNRFTQARVLQIDIDIIPAVNDGGAGVAGYYEDGKAYYKMLREYKNNNYICIVTPTWGDASIDAATDYICYANVVDSTKTTTEFKTKVQTERAVIGQNPAVVTLYVIVIGEKLIA